MIVKIVPIHIVPLNTLYCNVIYLNCHHHLHDLNHHHHDLYQHHHDYDRKGSGRIGAPTITTSTLAKCRWLMMIMAQMTMKTLDGDPVRGKMSILCKKFSPVVSQLV